MRSYAGIGSRKITEEERQLIVKIAGILSKKFILYSGNADGSDIAFQEGSKENCVVFLPWNGFNSKNYDPKKSLAYFVVNDYNSVNKYHPAPHNLSMAGRKLMGRNWFQVNGYEEFPKVSFVLFCADEVDGKVLGGTGQAVRIAQDLNIPCVNIRDKNWKTNLVNVL